MARKSKKQLQQEAAKKRQEEATALAIKYSGSVKITTKKGSKTVAVKKYHNAGGMQLFRFICLCLAGDYKTAERVRPFKIRLFNNSGDIASATPTANTDPVTGYISMDMAAVTENLTETDSYGVTTYKYSTTFHFIVPYSYVSGKSFNQINLYGVNVSDSTDYSAYYFMTDASSGTAAWDPVIIDDAVDSNTTWVIEWEMQVSNITE